MEAEHQEGGLELPVKLFALHITWIAWFFKFPFFFVLWKASYNYLVDIKEIHDAPRIIKLQKIIREFSDEAEYDDEEDGGGSPVYYNEQLKNEDLLSVP